MHLDIKQIYVIGVIGRGMWCIEGLVVLQYFY